MLKPVYKNGKPIPQPPTPSPPSIPDIEEEPVASTSRGARAYLRNAKNNMFNMIGKGRGKGKNGKSKDTGPNVEQCELDSEEPKINFALVNNPIHSVIEGIEFTLGNTNVCNKLCLFKKCHFRRKHLA